MEKVVISNRLTDTPLAVVSGQYVHPPLSINHLNHFNHFNHFNHIITSINHRNLAPHR